MFRVPGCPVPEFQGLAFQAPACRVLAFRGQAFLALVFRGRLIQARKTPVGFHRRSLLRHPHMPQAPRRLPLQQLLQIF
ncbi:hypothetical protein ASD34_12665 [Variovorax sp. Root473]|nr:hypothetical protein ASD34_12665 [Variovorax sp. Root473]